MPRGPGWWGRSGSDPLAGATATERALARAYARGEWLEVPPGAGLIRSSVRAEVVTALLVGAAQPEPGKIPALRLRGARITGTLELSGGTVTAEIAIDRCVFEQAPRVVGATVRTLAITASTLPGLDCSWSSVDGHLVLSGSSIRGTTWMLGTRLAGEMITNSAQLGAGGLALNMSGATLNHSWFGRDGFRVSGEIKAHGARFHAGMFLEGAELSHPGGQTFRAEHALIEGQMEWTNGFRSHGTVWLRDSTIACTFSLHEATLQAGDLALNLARTEIHELVLTPGRAIEGDVSFANATIRVLTDDPATWPLQVRTDGLTYQTLRPANLPVARRVDWIRRHPGGYQAQPYEQLADYYRRLGHDDLARRVLLAKQRARRRTLRVPGRAWSVLLDWTVGYGYRPWLSTAWLLALVTAGTVTFSLVPPQLLNPTGVRPYFHPLIYTIDLINPLGSFGMRAAYSPAGWTPWLAYGLIVTGWILATAVIAGAARVLKRT
ncbi:hypothetical protein [Nonomuraea sp. NPDC049480]|uniref:hypothetical protein n=1 Tax=Nonomuraea sp. NPDC049480 TaxID=3364353 RepID=UPI00378D4B71